MTFSSKFKPIDDGFSSGRFKQQNPPPPSNNAHGVTGMDTDRSILSYPMDVGDNPRFANYMLFTTYSMTPAKVKPIKPIMKFVSDGDFGGGFVVDKVATTKAQNTAAANALDAAANKLKNADKTNSSILISDNHTKSKKTIALYMPASVNAKYNMQFQEEEIGVMSEAIRGVIKQIQAGAGVGAALGSQANNLGTAATQMGLKALDSILPGAKDLVAIERGTIIAPRMEVMFQGIGKRSFEFQFTMIPKNRKETYEIYEIVKEFKRAMTPSFRMNGSVRELSFPDQFQIAYMHIGKDNTFLNKIGRCYLESADVTYGGDNFITHEPIDGGAFGPSGAPPSKVVLSLSFKEIETMDRSRIEQGF
jgi:hypothetical protein